MTADQFAQSWERHLGMMRLAQAEFARYEADLAAMTDDSQPDVQPGPPWGPVFAEQAREWWSAEQSDTIWAGGGAVAEQVDGQAWVWAPADTPPVDQVFPKSGHGPGWHRYDGMTDTLVPATSTQPGSIWIDPGRGGTPPLTPEEERERVWKLVEMYGRGS